MIPPKFPPLPERKDKVRCKGQDKPPFKTAFPPVLFPCNGDCHMMIFGPSGSGSANSRSIYGGRSNIICCGWNCPPKVRTVCHKRPLFSTIFKSSSGVNCQQKVAP